MLGLVQMTGHGTLEVPVLYGMSVVFSEGHNYCGMALSDRWL